MEKKKKGPKRLPIDWNIVKERLSLFVETTDIAAELGVSVRTLEERCQQPINTKQPELGGLNIMLSLLRQQCRARTKKQLLAAQIKAAVGTTLVLERDEKGNATKIKHVYPDTQMLIHLGKNFLDQSDKVKNELSFAGFIVEDENSEGDVLPPMLNEDEE